MRMRVRFWMRSTSIDPVGNGLRAVPRIANQRRTRVTERHRGRSLQREHQETKMANLHKLQQDMCEIGRRIYAKGFAAANDGNITVRVGENEILCTPTLHCKGFLKPEDICLIDMTGKQLAGIKKRSSEALLHLEIYRQRADVKSVVHCHPPHACAFAIAREPIPQCILPEVEVFLGDVPITKYETPGGQAFADTIAPFVKKTNIIILANHGT